MRPIAALALAIACVVSLIGGSVWLSGLTLLAELIGVFFEGADLTNVIGLVAGGLSILGGLSIGGGHCIASQASE